MNIPVNMSNTLQGLGIAYEEEACPQALLISRLQRSNGKDTQLVRVTLLQSGKEKIQLLSSATALFRLDMIIEQLGQQITAADNGFEPRLVDVKKRLSPLPQDSKYRVIVDASLFQAQHIYLPTGNKDSFLRLTSEAFLKLIAGYEVVSADLPLEKMAHHLAEPDTDAEKLQRSIRNYTARKIEKNLHETLDIPPLSHIAQKIIQLSANPHAEADDLVSIVELDPSLTAQVVGWAASPYYSAPGKVNSIRDAIVRVLGFELVMSLAMGLAIGKTLSVPRDCPRGASSFWRQSVYCAILMEKLNRLTSPHRRVESGLCYITGLLNNFGYLILAHVFQAHFIQLCQYQAVNQHLHPSLLETYLLGICRDEMAGLLMRNWNLPLEVCDAIRFQQLPEYRGENYRYANLCFMAKNLLAAKGIGDPPGTLIPVALYEDMGLSASQVEDTLEELLSAAPEVDAMTAVLAQ